MTPSAKIYLREIFQFSICKNKSTRHFSFFPPAKIIPHTIFQWKLTHVKYFTYVLRAEQAEQARTTHFFVKSSRSLLHNFLVLLFFFLKIRKFLSQNFFIREKKSALNIPFLNHPLKFIQAKKGQKKCPRKYVHVKINPRKVVTVFSFISSYFRNKMQVKSPAPLMPALN